MSYFVPDRPRTRLLTLARLLKRLEAADPILNIQTLTFEDRKWVAKGERGEVLGEEELEGDVRGFPPGMAY